MAATCARQEFSRRVLVVEDDHSICELIGEMLEPMGLQTICVQSDRDAHQVLREQSSITALLVDVNLGPGTTGFDVARFARHMIPDVPVIYISGQSSLHSFKTFGVPESLFLAKPFTGDELREAVRSRIPANDG